MDIVVMSTEKLNELSDWITKQPIETVNEFPIKPHEIYDYKTAEELEDIVKSTIEASNVKSQHEHDIWKAKEVDSKHFDRVKTFFGYVSKEEIYSAINRYAVANNLRIVSLPEPKDQSPYCYSDYTTTVVFDRL